jgi:hypothetical protein
MGIYRVLQGFEVVLLSVLIYQILSKKLLLIYLDHDDVLILTKKTVDPNKICESLSKYIFSLWSNYLLGESLPIEPNRIYGQVQKF